MRTMPSFEDVFHQFENRRRYEHFTLAILASITDDQIEQALRDYLQFHLASAYAAAPEEPLAGLPPGIRAYYYIHRLEIEVNAGGYNQYFFNPGGRFAPQALESLRWIGEEEAAGNLEAAIAVHLAEQADPLLQALYAQRTEEAFFETYEHTRLNQCDDDFYALRPRLHETILRFIRQNPENFVHSA